jgi:hypothetical protein
MTKIATGQALDETIGIPCCGGFTMADRARRSVTVRATANVAQISALTWLRPIVGSSMQRKRDEAALACAAQSFNQRTALLAAPARSVLLVARRLKQPKGLLSTGVNAKRDH